MTGVYTISIRSRLEKASADAAKCRKSLAALSNQDSAYAKELYQLLAILESVAQVYRTAPQEPS
jgi:hypothetical protein